MTECCSTIAIEDTLLGHIEARSESDGRLAFRGPSLFTGYATERGLIDPKIDGWFVSEDLGDVEGRTLRVAGRAGDFVKIGGESVDLKRLDRILYELAGDDAAIVAVADERLGHVIHLATAIEPSFVDAFNERVHPFETNPRSASRRADSPTRRWETVAGATGEHALKAATIARCSARARR